jgi:hypothetical protein
MMEKNIGRTDRWIRIVLGVALLLLVVFIQSGWRWWGLIGIIPLATALFNFCPLYALLGINTNKHNSNDG